MGAVAPEGAPRRGGSHGTHDRLRGARRGQPPLNEIETDYLRAFARTRRWDRPAGPYVVLPADSHDDERKESAGDRYGRPAPGAPGLWCSWAPCGTGHCLAFDGSERFYAPGEWMAYLIDHFLRPGAIASLTDDPPSTGSRSTTRAPV